MVHGFMVKGSLRYDYNTRLIKIPLFCLLLLTYLLHSDLTHSLRVVWLCKPDVRIPNKGGLFFSLS